jgi:hypothetical protein
MSEAIDPDSAHCKLCLMQYPLIADMLRRIKFPGAPCENPSKLYRNRIHCDEPVLAIIRRNRRSER